MILLRMNCIHVTSVHTPRCVSINTMPREVEGEKGQGRGERGCGALRAQAQQGTEREKNRKDSLQCSFTYRPVGATGMLLDHKSTSG